MHSFSKTLIGSLFVLSPLSAAMAADQVHQLPVITNTVANIVEQDSQKTLAAVTVINREEIERKQFTSLQELLRTVPGVTYTNSGGLGQPTSISIRGTGSTAVLVLVDGQKLGSATSGQTSFEHLPIDQIERVEVVKGPRSSLYGSEAVGGVIQIFTRKGTQNGVKPFASLKYGSHETYDANVGVNIRQDNSWATLSLAGLKTQGMDVTTLPTETDKDGYENYSASIKAGHQFNDQFSADLNVLYVNGETHYDNASNVNPYNKIEQNVYGVGFSYSPIDLWKTQLKFGRSEDKYETFSADKSTGVFDTTKDSISWLNTLSFNANNTLLVGVDYLNDQVDSTTNYDEKERDNVGYYAQYLGDFGRVNLQAAIRLDDNEQFGDHTTGNAAVGYSFNDNYSTYVSYGTAFRSPTFNDLYYPGWSNPNLVPEESENIEIGFKGSQWLNWSVSAFHNEIDNMISGGTNIAKAKIKGVEAEFGQSLDNFTWNLNYTYQEPEYNSGANKGKQIAGRAGQLLNLSADYNMDKWTLGGSVHAEDQRYKDAANTTSFGSFATADVRLTYQATPEFSVQAKLANMFDKEYYTVYDSFDDYYYRQEGRTAWVTLRYAMK
ncbi:TonB-dependent receptor [Acinetobacter cumulans]|uniref:TonB-dependent receptor domain-containing protein n=1 Tax=Acinetobacter cumulans TaxID=2136182 RepID=UPI000EA1BA4C|nr:TonB-dependent receptor [Acinetobacter cumulans]RKG49362.1 TonB-dependent receptor [Acinetobacter cumulans]